MFALVMISVSRMCIRVRRGRQRLRDRCHAENRQAMPKFFPGDRRGWPFTWLLGLRRAGCEGDRAGRAELQAVLAEDGGIVPREIS